jgi:alpha-ketoglutarate-dependent taurine dioxygenase
VTRAGKTLNHGRQLLEDLMDFATQDDFTYGHLWRKGDLVLWDNRCTLHSPTPFDSETKKRLMYRITIIAPAADGSD